MWTSAQHALCEFEEHGNRMKNKDAKVRAARSGRPPKKPDQHKTKCSSSVPRTAKSAVSLDVVPGCSQSAREGNMYAREHHLTPRKTMVNITNKKVPNVTQTHLMKEAGAHGSVAPSVRHATRPRHAMYTVAWVSASRE